MTVGVQFSPVGLYRAAKSGIAIYKNGNRKLPGPLQIPSRYDHILQPQRVAVNPSPRANEIMHGVMKMLGKTDAHPGWKIAR